MTDIIYMEEVLFRNVAEVLQRKVAPDGRVGGLQRYKSKLVDVVIYREEAE